MNDAVTGGVCVIVWNRVGAATVSWSDATCYLRPYNNY